MGVGNCGSSLIQNITIIESGLIRNTQTSVQSLRPGKGVMDHRDYILEGDGIGIPDFHFCDGLDGVDGGGWGSYPAFGRNGDDEGNKAASGELHNESLSAAERI